MSEDKGFLEDFLDFYQINLVNENKRCIKKSNFRFFSDPTNANVVKDSRDFYYREYQDRAVDTDMEYERMFVLEIPESTFKQLMHLHHKFYTRTAGAGHTEMARTIVEREWAEHRLRSQYPAVQTAWEQYSLLLHLSSNGKELP